MLTPPSDCRQMFVLLCSVVVLQQGYLWLFFVWIGPFGFLIHTPAPFFFKKHTKHIDSDFSLQGLKSEVPILNKIDVAG